MPRVPRAALLSLLSLLIGPGCGFDAPGADRSGDSDAGVDAAPCWSRQPALFDPCDLPTPQGALDLSMTGTYIYDTEIGILTNPNGDPVAHASGPLAHSEQNAWILSVNSLDVRDLVILRAVGDLPLIIASEGEIHIHPTGAIDASSNDITTGAGANPTVCGDHLALSGQSDTGGGAGGGGGGFSGRGGNGGNGNSDGSAESVGGMAGARTGTPAFMRGGCRGAPGGDGDTAGSAGNGGSGGGAVVLSSQTSIAIEGTIHVGGAGGRGGVSREDAGGGGGGSGGFIGLDGGEISLADNSILAANGGGGGEGSSATGVGRDGAHARANGQRAAGGSGGASTGTDGGGGGAGDNRAGEDVGAALAGGGGGGGGGTGFIVAFGSVDDGPGPNTVSPPILPGAPESGQ